MYRIVIPARHGSSRLPGKPLLLLAGKPLLQHVHERALRAHASETLVATDDERIAQLARAFGARVVMTADHHPSGTDRIAEVARREGWAPGDIVVNLQGDEPLMPAALLDQVAQLLAGDAEAAIATLSAPIQSDEAFRDRNVVKVVCDAAGRALYFSRAPIPWPRDAAADAARPRIAGAQRHVGIYAYRVSALARLAGAAPTPLEQVERLEQLRALENGLRIRVAEAVESPGPDVNTPEDLARVSKLLQGAV